MKKLFMAILAIAMFFMLAGYAMADSITIGWDPLSNQENGVRVYIGTASRKYTNSSDAGIGTTEKVIENLKYGTTYYFALRAYNSNGDYSGLSNEVSYTTPTLVLPELPVLPVVETPTNLIIPEEI